MLERNWIEVQSSGNTLKYHVLPCSIAYSGPVDKSKLDIQQTDPPSARLRGRPLKGREIDLNLHGFKGFVLSPASLRAEVDEDEDTCVSQDDQPKAIKATQMHQSGSQFDKIMVWEHGKLPSSTDPWTNKLEELLALARSMSS